MAVLLAGCGGGSKGVSALPPAPSVSGRVTFDRVPSVPGVGLDYASTQRAPARAVTVEALDAAGTSVLASTVTDADGRYSFGVPAATRMFVRVRARMQRSGSPGWRFSVVDNTRNDAEYVLDGAPFQSGGAQTRDLHAPSGWNGSGYGALRPAAPFAILDVIYDGVATVLAAEPATVFPPLVVHWSADNVPSAGAFDPASGAIGTSFFDPAAGIYLLGAENVDTDEYDRHVIAHEWSHYLEASFSRTDSINGPHTVGDQLDLRVAFGEGWGNAFSAIATGDSLYRDTMDVGQTEGFSFDVEGGAGEPNPHPGWYSEQTVQELLYDLYDGGAEDPVSLGFAPLYEVMLHGERDTLALTSVFSFIEALESADPADAPAVDNLVAAAGGIDPIVDAYGSGETHAGEPTDPNAPAGDVLPIYAALEVDGPAVDVCSTDAYSSLYTGAHNKLGSRRFLEFTAAADGDYRFVAQAVPAAGDADPDLRLHHAGQLLPACLTATDPCPGESPVPDREDFTWPLTAGDYVLEVYEWTNTNGYDDPSPPRGRTCFDVTVSGP